LAFIGAEAQDYLYPALTSDSEEVRAAVIGAIAKVAEAETKEDTFTILIQALNDPSENVRSEAAAALGNLAYKPAIPALLELLQHPSSESRKAAVLALMKIGNRATLTPLQAALEQESDVALQPILKLAISQLEKRVESSDWD
jgi:bilin biosynthesis protein